MPRAKTHTSATFEQPGLKPADGLRPDVLLRLELLRIVYRPDKDAAWNVKQAEGLQRYAASGSVD